MSSESVCQVARSWVEVRSFHTRLFGVVHVTCGDFHDGSEKGRVSVHQSLCQSWETCCGDPHNNSTSLQGPKLARVFQWHTRFKTGQHQLIMTNRQGDTQTAQLLKLLPEFKSLSVRIEVGPFTTFLRRWELVVEHANGF